MAKIYKFTKAKKPYSDTFLTGVKPEIIGDFIQEQNPHMSVKAADAMALAIIYSTYLQLVLDEEGSKQTVDDFKDYIWAANDKETLH